MCTTLLFGWDPATPPSPHIWTHITRALLVSKDGRHLFVTPWFGWLCPVYTHWNTPGAPAEYMGHKLTVLSYSKAYDTYCIPPRSPTHWFWYCTAKQSNAFNLSFNAHANPPPAVNPFKLNILYHSNNVKYTVPCGMRKKKYPLPISTLSRAKVFSFSCRKPLYRSRCSNGEVWWPNWSKFGPRWLIL